MPHLNQLVEKYGKKGFVIVGVTSEPEGPTQKFIEDTKFLATVALDNGKAMREYGFGGYPSSALVDPTGKVVWTGHPSGLNDKQIEEHLGKVRMRASSELTLELELPRSLKSIQKNLEKGKLGYALAKLEEEIQGDLDDDERTAVQSALEAVKSLRDEQLASAGKAKEEGRLHDAITTYELVAKHFKGHATSDEAGQSAKTIEDDPELALEIDAGEKIAEALELMMADKESQAIRKLKGVVSGKYEATREATRAKTLLEELEAE